MHSLFESSPEHQAIGKRLQEAIAGEVMFDAFSRGRYATDASIYQVAPLGVVVPRRLDDLNAIVEIATEEGLALLARGGGTSQSGQTVGRALVIDFTKFLNDLVSLDVDRRVCVVEPGIVLDELNRQLAPYGLWFPIDVSTSSRATIGGMTGNNSCGTRSIRYGIMRDRVRAIDAILADGSEVRFDTEAGALNGSEQLSNATRALIADTLALGARDAEHIAGAFPEVSRRVGGYNIDALLPGQTPVNLATLLVGSEGTLALSRQIELSLAPVPKQKVLGICHFPRFRDAMEAAQHIVKLGPVAVEVVDRTLIELARDIPMFRQTMDRFVRGRPDALLLTEFAEDAHEENLRRLDRLDELMADFGFAESLVRVVEPEFQKAVWEVRKAGLNIMMSMKSEGKPVSFIEDCAIPLPHLADYTDQLTEVFAKHGTRGTWYAHASVGCLHVRPVLNLKLDEDAKTMRAIAEEAFELVRKYKGAHSGEHGDGLVRSEFHEPMYGRKTVALFEEIKDRFDPAGRMNPGKIVRPPRMDDRTLFRYAPNYSVGEAAPALRWEGFSGARGGFQGAIEMCNNNGACRKLEGGVMCPSFRVTRNERDLTRGRANALRLAMSGQLGANAFASDDMMEAMKLCVSCKGCRRECPTGVDMAKMKIEVLAARVRESGLGLHDRLVAYLPRYAPWAARLHWAMNARDRLPGADWASERLAGFSARRRLPRWQAKPFRLERGRQQPVSDASLGRVALLVDTFNTYFEPENLTATVELLGRLGYQVELVEPNGGGRPVCCGRTFLSAGLVDEARAEGRRLVDAVQPFLDDGVAIVGIEPSCILTLRDEFLSLDFGDLAQALGERSFLLEEFLLNEIESGALAQPLGRYHARVLMHGHSHQKAFGVADQMQQALELVEGLEVNAIETSCCGMAGAFGYGADTYDVSVKMAELSLLPAVRAAEPEVMIAANGFSCRHQIQDGSGRRARHIAKILLEALKQDGDRT